MIGVLLVSSDDSIADCLRQAIGDVFGLIPGPGPQEDPAATLTRVLQATPPQSIVVLDARPDAGIALQVAEQARLQRGANVVLVSPPADGLAVAALRVGVRDLLPPDVGPGELRAALDRIAGQEAQPSAEPDPLVQGRLVAVASPKGGVGKTTVATNLAVGLAQRHPQSVVLVDLDVHFGDVASALNLSPEYTLPDIARGPASRDTIVVKSYLSRHETGLLVVPGSDSPAAADAVTADDVNRLLVLLNSQFAWVVVDTAPGLSDHTLSVFDHTDTLILVTSLDVPGVRGLRKELDTLDQLGIAPGARHVVLNFNDASRGLSVADVEATIGTRVDVAVPLSTAVPLSVNQGIPLVQTGGRDTATKALMSVLDLVDPSARPDRPKIFGRRRS